MPTASSPTEELHRLLMTDPKGCPTYNQIPTVARWHGDVAAMMNRLRLTRDSQRAGMRRQSGQLLVGGQHGQQQPQGRIAGDLTNYNVVGEAIDRYWVGTRNAGKPTNFLSQSAHGSLLTDIYTVTGRFMRAISGSPQLRTDNDCALFPLYRALHFAAADAFGLVYGINGDEIEIYLRKQLIGLTAHGAEVDTAVGNVFPDPGQPTVSELMYLSDQEALACRLHVKEGRFWIRGGHGDLVRFDCSGEDFKLDYEKGITNKAYLGVENNNNKGVAGFAMGHNRHIYASFHANRGGVPKGRFYHSSYLSGGDVLCTGCITVVEGNLTYINNASGHYAPSPQQLSLTLQALRALGLDISGVTVDLFDKDHENFTPQSVTSFLRIQQGAGFKKSQFFTNDQLVQQRAQRIRAALAAYETRAKGFWSNPSQKSKSTVINLKAHPDNDVGNKMLFEEVLFLLNKSNDSPRFASQFDRLDNNSELAKQLKRAIEA